ncbi:uncharacterized protein LOC111786385 [Cucurbita pepo subsp. pepo]|uniref:uncharacterized protein LOC111786385 n=1 Tax=Cucurbita pepo subsp. pepo TaxID=3664 RepID=UPI000C9D96B5|nr:uncharacterized protein LOC111786385 [Cucurbita pepo subsp. pepo]
MLKSRKKIAMAFRRWATDVDWRLLFLVLTPLSLIAFFSVSTVPAIPFSSLAPLRSFIIGASFQQPHESNHRTDDSSFGLPPSKPPRGAVEAEESAEARKWRKKKAELQKSKMAVCLVGGARRFEVTGPSITENILKEYPNADLFLHSPLDRNSFKLSYLRAAPKLAAVKIFKPKPIPETESQVRLLTAANSPNGIQGLLQYFNLVEGCLTMIRTYQELNNFTYDWIVRTRVDGFWNAPLRPDNFVSGQYVVPPGSSYGGLNDRLGVGDLNTSTVALSRLALIPKLDAAGLRQLNSETAFKEQLTTGGVPFVTKRLPFCIVTERQYNFPPRGFGVPVAAMSSPGPLSGTKCRPCKVICEGECVEKVMGSLDRGWSWTDWENGSMGLCDARGDWEMGWEKLYEDLVGEEMADASWRIQKMKTSECSDGFSEMKRRSGIWEAPAAEVICRVGSLKG